MVHNTLVSSPEEARLQEANSEDTKARQQSPVHTEAPNV